MIVAEQYRGNRTLAATLDALHKELVRENIDAVVGITNNIARLLQKTTQEDMIYNAFQVGVAVDVAKKDLPCVSRDTYRPHHYLQDIETLTQEGVVMLDFVLPLPLEFGDDGLPYALAVKMYSGERGRVSGLTLNLGDTVPHHIFFYMSEVRSLAFGDAAHAEFPVLLKTKKI